MEEILAAIPKDFHAFVEPLEWTGYIFFVLIIGEWIFDAVKSNPNRKHTQGFVDLGVFIGHELVGRIAGTSVFLATLLFFSKHTLFRLPVNAYTWMVGLVIADFLYYWSHRLEHRSRLFWTWHNVHHSSTDYNGTTALRLGWLEPLVSWYLLVPMALLGFNPFQIIVLFQILLTYQTWIHTQKIGKLGWFEWIFNSPSSHRVHHGANKQYIDKNFGALFIIWDRLFGTYAAETETVRYGLTHNIRTNNPVLVNLHEPIAFIKGLRKVRGVKRALYWIFGPPVGRSLRGE